MCERVFKKRMRCRHSFQSIREGEWVRRLEDDQNWQEGEREWKGVKERVRQIESDLVIKRDCKVRGTGKHSGDRKEKSPTSPFLTYCWHTSMPASSGVKLLRLLCRLLQVVFVLRVACWKAEDRKRTKAFRIVQIINLGWQSPKFNLVKSAKRSAALCWWNQWVTY